MTGSVADTGVSGVDRSVHLNSSLNSNSRDAYRTIWVKDYAMPDRGDRNINFSWNSGFQLVPSDIMKFSM